MASSDERNDDARRWADRTNWDALMNGVDNRTRDPSEGLSEYLGGASIPSGFDSEWEDGLNRSDAQDKYENKTSDPDTWLDSFEDTDNWNMG